MKKIFSLLFALLILVSGMHLTMATHICGDEIAAVKWSIMNENAGCGMENRAQNSPTDTNVSSACCQDRLNAYTTDSNYSPSTFQLNKPTQAPVQAFYIPANIGLLLSDIGFTTHVNVPPPDTVRPSAVYLADICVFLI